MNGESTLEDLKTGLDGILEENLEKIEYVRALNGGKHLGPFCESEAKLEGKSVGRYETHLTCSEIEQCMKLASEAKDKLERMKIILENVKGQEKCHILQPGDVSKSRLDNKMARGANYARKIDVDQVMEIKTTGERCEDLTKKSSSSPKRHNFVENECKDSDTYNAEEDEDIFYTAAEFLDTSEVTSEFIYCLTTYLQFI